MSAQDVESALAVIRRAIHNEIDGQRFYHDAAFFCIDPWAKEVFATLAREEEEHTRLLLLEYEALTTKGGWIDPEAALLSGVRVDITQFTFPEDDASTDEVGEKLFPPQWSTAETVDRRANDLEALAFGMQMEKKAMVLYQEQATRVQNPAARKAYEFLVDEETRHYHQLKDQWEKLAGRPFEAG